MIESEKEYERRCTATDQLASEANRQRLEQRYSPIEQVGEWQNQRKWRSLYRRKDRIILDDERVLLANDYVFVPSGISAVLYGGRSVRRHCLSESNSAVAERLRGLGLGVKPTLDELVD